MRISAHKTNSAERVNEKLQRFLRCRQAERLDADYLAIIGNFPDGYWLRRDVDISSPIIGVRLLHLIGEPSTGFGIDDTVEVCGSSPHGPTIIFNTLESFLRNPTETSPVILHL
jgi:hypothetical protein